MSFSIPPLDFSNSPSNFATAEDNAAGPSSPQIPTPIDPEQDWLAPGRARGESTPNGSVVVRNDLRRVYAMYTSDDADEPGISPFHRRNQSSKHSEESPATDELKRAYSVSRQPSVSNVTESANADAWINPSTNISPNDVTSTLSDPFVDKADPQTPQTTPRARNKLRKRTTPSSVSKSTGRSRESSFVRESPTAQSRHLPTKHISAPLPTPAPPAPTAPVQPAKVEMKAWRCDVYANSGREQRIMEFVIKSFITAAGGRMLGGEFMLVGGFLFELPVGVEIAAEDVRTCRGDGAHGRRLELTPWERFPEPTFDALRMNPANLPPEGRDDKDAHYWKYME